MCCRSRLEAPQQGRLALFEVALVHPTPIIPRLGVSNARPTPPPPSLSSTSSGTAPDTEMRRQSRRGDKSRESHPNLPPRSPRRSGCSSLHHPTPNSPPSPTSKYPYKNLLTSPPKHRTFPPCPASPSTRPPARSPLSSAISPRPTSVSATSPRGTTPRSMRSPSTSPPTVPSSTSPPSSSPRQSAHALPRPPTSTAPSPPSATCSTTTPTPAPKPAPKPARKPAPRHAPPRLFPLHPAPQPRRLLLPRPHRSFCRSASAKTPAAPAISSSASPPTPRARSPV